MICLYVSAVLFVCMSHFATVQSYPFRNISLTFEERVDDLVSRLTLEEMQLQMARGGVGDYGGPAPQISRLGE